MTPSGLLDRATLLSLLDELSLEAEARGVRVELFLVGGAAMTLAYDSERSTADLDAVFVPTSEVRAIAETVAANHPELGLDPTWPNDGVKGFLPGEDPNAVVFYDRPHLSVSIASARYLFILKAIAAREVDDGDLRTLWPLTGFTNASQALDAINAAYPRQPIKAAVQYLVEDIAATSTPQR